MNRVAPLLALLALLAGCTGDDAPEDPEASSSSPGRVAPLTLVEFGDGGSGTSTELRGCVSAGDDEDAGYTRPVLVWARIRLSEPLRVKPATYAPRSNSLDGITQFVGPDPGPKAPHLAVSIADAGVGPTENRKTSDTRLIGDERNSPVGLAAAQRSWSSRVDLPDRGLDLDPGDHYLFLEVDPAKGGMDLHQLRLPWQSGQERGETPIGSLSLRVHCGG